MPTLFKNGVISKDGVNQGVPIKNASGAPGQSANAGNIPFSMDNLPGPVKDVGQKIFDGLGGGTKNFKRGALSAHLFDEFTSRDEHRASLLSKLRLSA